MVLAAVIAVRSRFMKAVFFFKDESRELLTLNRSVSEIRLSSLRQDGKHDVPVSPAQAFELT